MMISKKNHSTASKSNMSYAGRVKILEFLFVQEASDDKHL
jgi:hypothetical protein